MTKFKFDLSELNNLDRYKNIFPRLIVNDVADFKYPKDSAIYFVNDEKHLKEISFSKSLIIINNSIKLKSIKNGNFIYSCDNPRLEFAIILNEIIKKTGDRNYKVLDNTAVVGESTVIGDNTVIEPGVFIDDDVHIGNNCIIQSGARIYSGVNIGNNSIIGSNSTIGLSGFGIESDLNGKTYRIPHFGGVNIGSNVYIGSLTNIHAGTIQPTIIEDFVQIDSLVHIAHNVQIKKSSQIVASAEISGSVIIEENSFIGGNSSIIQKTIVAKNSILGIGATLTKSFPENSVMAGNPADLTKNLAVKSKALKKLIKTGEY